MVKQSAAPLDRIFHALADPTRRAILQGLRRGPSTVTELARPFPISLAAVSKHLRALEQAGLVERTVDGRTHRLRLRPQPLAEAWEWIAAYQDFWEARIAVSSRS